MIYEMRVYPCVPGDIRALLQRFETITLRIWERIGLRPAALVTTLVGSNHDLTCFPVWKPLAERERHWNTFSTNPERIEARAAHGDVVANSPSSFLARTASSTVRWPNDD